MGEETYRSTPSAEALEQSKEIDITPVDYVFTPDSLLAHRWLPTHRADYVTFAMEFRNPPDEQFWTCDRTTVEPDITPYELVQILSFSITLSDSIMERIKENPRLMRHFRRVEGK